MKNFIKMIKKCFNEESYVDDKVYKINMSIMIASTVLFCLACILFFL